MTYKEALEKVVRSDHVDRVILTSCPADRYDYTCPYPHCEDCWNREMPEGNENEEEPYGMDMQRL